MMSNWKRVRAGMLAFAVAAACTMAPARAADAGRKEIEKAVTKVYPALVRIFVVMTEPGGGRLNRQAGSGSGAIITADGYIVTNHHVAGKAERLVCRMPDGEELDAKLVGTDPLADIAVIKLDLSTSKTNRKLTVAEFGDSDKLKVGDIVLAMGCPGGISQSVTRGIVSNAAMIMPKHMAGAFRLDGEDTGSLVRWIAHDAVIFGGNSGGPLVNLKGEIIGVNEIGVANLSGAIPGNLAKSVALQIIEKGHVERSWTGIEGQPRPKSSGLDQGMLVSGVIEGSPAEKAGILPGDYLMEFDGEALNCRIPEDMPPFNRLVLGTPVGKSVKLKLLRNGAAMELALTTVARDPAEGKDVELKDWGMTARDLTLMEAMEMRRPSKDGVLVTSTSNGGACGQAKPALQPGDIISAVDGQPVKRLADLKAVTKKAVAGKKDRVPVLVAMERDTNQLLTVVRVGKDPKQDPPKSPKRAWFPVRLQPITEDLAKALKLPEGTKGLRVTYVVPRRGADKAGMKVGDLLLKMDGDKLLIAQPEEVSQFLSTIRQYDPGSEHEFAILRDGKPATLTVALDPADTDAASVKRYKDNDFEMGVRDLTFDDRVEMQLPEKLDGVLVDYVTQAGLASLAMLESGDVILSIDGTATPDSDTVEKLMKAAKEKRQRQVLLFVRRGIHTLFLEMEADWDSNGNGNGNGSETNKEKKA
jgi:serine protease Do